MKHIFPLFLFINLTNTLLSQDNLWNYREDIILQYGTQDANYHYEIQDETNKITVRIFGKDNSLEITHFIRPHFDGTIDNESLCDSLEIKLLSQHYVERQLSNLINSKERKWIKLSDSLYVSSKWVSKFWPYKKLTLFTIPMMAISKEDQQTTISLYTRDLTKKEWSDLKKKSIL